MFAKKLLRRVITHKTVMREYVLPATSINKSNGEVNIVRSKIPSIAIPDLLVNEYAWRNVDKWYDKTAVVSSNSFKKTF